MRFSEDKKTVILDEEGIKEYERFWWEEVENSRRDLEEVTKEMEKKLEEFIKEREDKQR